MRKELLSAVQNGEPWLNRFSRREYTEAFRDYTEQFGPLYLEAVRGAGDQLDALAEELLNALEAERPADRFWKRSAALVWEKMVLVQYLSPMLLGLEEPGCTVLAELLRDKWRGRYPGEAYELASYQTIQSGFRDSVFESLFKREEPGR